MFFLKNRLIHFHINSTTVFRLVKQTSQVFQHWNQQATSCPSPVSHTSDSSSEANYSLNVLITFRVKSSIICIDSNITDNIIRKIINVQWEKCETNNRPLSQGDYSAKWRINPNWGKKIKRKIISLNFHSHT